MIPWIKVKGRTKGYCLKTDTEEKSMRKKQVLFILTAILLTLSGCGARVQKGEGLVPPKGQDTEEKTELAVFYSGEDARRISVMEELCEKFMEENQDIQLISEHSGSGIYSETLKAKEAAGEFPDIFEIQDPYTFAEAGKLGVITENVGKLVEQPFTIDGNIYAVPFYKTSFGIIYNQVIFKELGLEVPRTYGEFLEVCRTLKQSGTAPLAAGGNPTETGKYWLNYYFQVDIAKEDPNWQKKKNEGRVSFQDDNVKKMLTDYQDMMNGEYMLEDSVNMNENQVIQALINQDAAMVLTAPSMVSKIWEAYPLAVESGKNTLGEELEEDPCRFRLGWFFLQDQAGEPVVVSEKGAQWAVSDTCGENAEKNQAAMRFLEFCYRKENYRKVLQTVYAIPATKEKILYPAPAVQQSFLVDYRYADKSDVYLGNEDTPENFKRSMYDVFFSVATKTMSVDTAAEKLDEYWDNMAGG
ncbi:MULTISPECIES: ABC transporter substrate-binding protein [Blautia]|uniref:Carbohydrate ABC transporter substrate-binding protein n=4 Tax=Blautia producta TaxID=33035 RepID=A0A7G5MNY5_9FIRM|nr:MULTISPECIES: ABC transporter substrate-binding protein [Blautia]MCQ4745994.1 ABC transporter substrate-binding protein [Blautia producta]MDU5219516.1 ABC transporter substrate-binding protein [Blautia producta]MDU5384373.1 ABC transporter substrate-binding protein [Blautia producta]MDU6885283.1 ABC transporter substrate-binding protein [Blautia producta]QIB55806.1 carbohydrate ABC transporter substrate-binding protein [Blautia producta ATCC 27340 = DSM 2950]